MKEYLNKKLEEVGFKSRIQYYTEDNIGLLIADGEDQIEVIQYLSPFILSYNGE